MPNDDEDRAALQHYATLIRAAMPREVLVPASDSQQHRVESGVVLASSLRGGPIRSPLRAPTEPDDDAVFDVIGHQRPHYRGLMVYCAVKAMAGSNDSDAGVLRAWRDVLGKSVINHPMVDAPIPASLGAVTTRVAWDALALLAIDPAACEDVARAVFNWLTRQQQSDGSFLVPSASDNPETFWFHELVLLHAAASYAAMTGEAEVARAVTRHTEWVQNETQPDHATSDPWGLHAFIVNPATRPTADALLHAVRVQHPQGATGVGLMLLADALYCLRPPDAYAAAV